MRFDEVAANPRILYHGTNILAGGMIVRDGMVRADNPVDDDDMGAVVCATSLKKIARMFAVEFVRFNSRLPVGVVFAFDGQKLFTEMTVVPYEAETASVDEREYRIVGDVSLDRHLLKAGFVGKSKILRSQKWRERFYDDEAYRYFAGYAGFDAALDKLIELAAR